MAKIWLAKIEEGKPKMKDYVRAKFNEWCKENEGKMVRIEALKKPVSPELRAYYFAAVIPVLKQTCEEWQDLTSAEMHEVVKKMFFYFETYNPRTKRVERFGRSVMSDSEWNNTHKAQNFLEILAGYLAEHGLEMPSSEEYKALRDGQKEELPEIEYPEEDAHPTAF